MSATSADALGALLVFGYYALLAAAIMLLSRLFSAPKEIVRKTYHLMCSGSIFLLLYCFRRWWAAVLVAGALFITAYLLMPVLEKIPAFRFIRRAYQDGEIRRQILSVLGIFLLMIAVFWGVLGPDGRLHAAVGFVAWGAGDALAGIVGKRFGKTRRWFSSFAPKTVEGTLAMIAASFFAIFITLTVLTSLSIWARLPLAVTLAWAAAAAELVTSRGWDTVSVPPTVAILSFWLMPVFNGLVAPWV